MEAAKGQMKKMTKNEGETEQIQKLNEDVVKNGSIARKLTLAKTSHI